MSTPRFTRINEPFQCANCGHSVPAHSEGSCRNHCNRCLASLHLDINPGDRASPCQGLMKAHRVTIRKVHEMVIHHQCEKCGDIRSNIAAADDDFDSLLRIMRERN